MLGLITGANRGLGLELVRLGPAQGDSILAACRNTDGEQMTELLALKTDYPAYSMSKYAANMRSCRLSIWERRHRRPTAFWHSST